MMTEDSFPAISPSFAEFTCRLCLLKDDNNLNILSSAAKEEGLLRKVSEHLRFEVKQDDELPKWICAQCCASLNSFHTFFQNVDEVQSKLHSMYDPLSGASWSNDGDSKLVDIKIEVDPGDVTPIVSTPPTTLATTPRRSTRKRKPKRKSSDEVEAELEYEQENINPDYNPVTENKSDEASISVRKENDSVLTSEGDDLSSLEDQDWFGKDFVFDNSENESRVSFDEDETWKPTSRRTKGTTKKSDNENAVRERRSMRKQTTGDGEEDRIRYSEDSNEDSMDNSSQLEPRNKKLRITATHGTLPKPKMPPGSRKIMRAKMNSMMVQFYGITCDICVNQASSDAAPVTPVTPVKYQTFEDLCTHMAKEHRERGYVKCCNCTMREKKRAERHMLLHTMPGSIYKCNICGKQLSSQQSFRCHILLHLPNSERPYKCTECDRGFVTKADLNHHKQQHLPEDKRFSYTCDICGSRFNYESGLVIHKQRVHENVRSHLCDICAKSFNSRCDMERHREQIHGNVKREQCPECGKWFKGASILKTHMRQHRGVEFQCQFCEKKYSVRSSWRAHLLMHSDEKPHKCPMCEKSFKHSSTLKMHLNQHTGDLPYSCQFCPKKFASSGNYYTHRKRMHSDEVAQLKKATEDSLAASGLPPPSAMARTNSKESITQAIARAKAKAASRNVVTSACAVTAANAISSVANNSLEAEVNLPSGNPGVITTASSRVAAPTSLDSVSDSVGNHVNVHHVTGNPSHAVNTISQAVPVGMISVSTVSSDGLNATSSGLMIPSVCSLQSNARVIGSSFHLTSVAPTLGIMQVSPMQASSRTMSNDYMRIMASDMRSEICILGMPTEMTSISEGVDHNGVKVTGVNSMGEVTEVPTLQPVSVIVPSEIEALASDAGACSPELKLHLVNDMGMN